MLKALQFFFLTIIFLLIHFCSHNAVISAWSTVKDYDWIANKNTKHMRRRQRSYKKRERYTESREKKIEKNGVLMCWKVGHKLNQQLRSLHFHFFLCRYIFFSRALFSLCLVFCYNTWSTRWGKEKQNKTKRFNNAAYIGNF